MNTKTNQMLNPFSPHRAESRDAELDRRLGELAYTFANGPSNFQASAFQMDRLIKEKGKRLSFVCASPKRVHGNEKKNKGHA